MSTPNPRHCKLEGLALYAPRRGRADTATVDERWRAKLERIAAAIETLITDTALRTRLADNAFAEVRERYDWQYIAGEFDNLYRKLVPSAAFVTD